MAKSKLHQLLAVQSTTENQANATRNELQGTFQKRHDHFRMTRKTFTANTEGAVAKTEEQSDIQTTVTKEVDWISEKIAEAIDVGYQIDIGNTQAKADIVLKNGDVIAKEVPATSLLQIEKRLVEVQNLIKTIPTLDPVKGFVPDTTQGAGIYKARDVEKNRTAKVQEPLILAPATDKHPAQVQLVTKDVSIGTIVEQEWSSMISVATKGQILDRVENLIRAVKSARSRANEQEVDVLTNKIGSKLLEYVFTPLKG